MPLTAIAKSFQIQSINFITDSAGTLTGLNINASVEFGTFGQGMTINLWPLLSTSEKAYAQNFYNAAKAKVQGVILG